MMSIVPIQCLEQIWIANAAECSSQADLPEERLGRTASGFVERPRFQRLVAEVCSAIGQANKRTVADRPRLSRNWYLPAAF